MIFIVITVCMLEITSKQHTCKCFWTITKVFKINLTYKVLKKKKEAEQ